MTKKEIYIIVLRGNKSTYQIRKKEKIGIIWAVNKQVHLHAIDDIYMVYSNLENINNSFFLQDFQIGIDNLQINLEGNIKLGEVNEFKNSFIDYQINRKLYNPKLQNIEFIGGNLFRCIINLPKTLNLGDYNLEIYLVSQNNRIIAAQSIPITVEKSGIIIFISELADKYSFLYGLIAILIALSLWLDCKYNILEEIICFRKHFFR